MGIENRLKEEQKIAYQTIYNGFLNKQISHAYLLSGSKGAPLKETAIFIAQSLICENPSPLACEECLSCLRLKNGSYVDFQLIDGEEKNINKDAIENLQEVFSLTALEEKGLKIYVIHLIEKANPVAINRLLKFLEEPGDDIYAILTTENIAKVLPTIISRCQVIRINKIATTTLENELIDAGLDKSDARILSLFNNSKEEALEVNGSNNYQMVKDLAYESFQNLFTNPLDIHYYIQSQVSPSLKDRNDCRLYLNILEVYLKELLFNRLDEILPKPFEMNKIAQEHIKVEDACEEVMLASGKIDSNVNIALLLNQLFYQIAKKGGLI